MGTITVEGLGPVQIAGDQPTAEEQRAIMAALQGGQAAPAAAPPHEYKKEEVLPAAASNFGKSLGQFAETVAQPFIHPIDFATNVGKLGLGLLSKAAHDEGAGPNLRGLDAVPGYQPEAKPEPTPEQKAERAKVEAPADAMGHFFKERYGGWGNIKRTLAEDPVGFLTDVAGVVTGGGGLLAKVPVIGKVAGIAGKVAQAVDPAQIAIRAPLAVASKGAGLLADTSGYLTGAGGKAVREAATAGEGSIPFVKGTDASETWRGHVTGAAPATEVADLGRSAIAKIEAGAKAKYNQQIADLGPNYKTNPVSWGGIDRAVEDMKDVTMSRAPGSTTGIVKNDAAESVRQAAEAKIAEFKNSPDAFHQTPAALDDLKKAIGKIDAPDGQSMKVRTELYNKVQAEIERQFPKYADAMKDYHLVMKQAGELEKMFSLGDNAQRNTAVGKLQKVGRNNVTSNYGALAQAFEKLVEMEPTLPAAISGQTLQSVGPRGLSSNMLLKAGAGAGLAETLQSLHAGHFALSPSQLAIAGGTGAVAAAATSPRLAGEAARVAGQLRTPYRMSGEWLRRHGINPAATTGVTTGLLGDINDSLQ